MSDRIERAWDILEVIGIFLLISTGLICLLAILAGPPKAPARSAHLTRFENFCDPEWKALEQYGARVNCYQE